MEAFFCDDDRARVPSGVRRVIMMPRELSIAATRVALFPGNNGAPRASAWNCVRQVTQVSRTVTSATHVTTITDGRPCSAYPYRTG